MKFGVGQSVTRKEDDALLRGAGRYVADHAPANLRMPWFCARRTRMRVFASPMWRRPGRCTAWRSCSPARRPSRLAICRAKAKCRTPRLMSRLIRCSCKTKCVTSATLSPLWSRIRSSAREDAAEAIAIDWEPLPHVVGAAAALESGAPLVWSDKKGNLAFETHLGDADATARAFAQATQTVTFTVVNQRLVTNYLDTRGVIAEYDSALERFTLTLGSQGSHAVRDVLCGAVLKIPPRKCAWSRPMSAAASGLNCFPTANMRWRLWPRVNFDDR